MKETALAGLLLCLAAVPATGQGVALGLRGGLNSATAKISTDGLDKTPRTTYHAGGIFGIGITRTFGLQLEGVYSRKGFATEADAAGALELAYIQIPLLAVGIVPTSPSSPITPHVFAGPSFGFEVACKVSDGSGGSVRCSDGGATTNTFEFGLLFGVGLSIGKGSMAFLIDVAYDWGLTDIADGAGSSVKNRTFMASAGFIFPVR